MRDLKELKQANRIEDLVEEAGYRLDRKPGQRYWFCIQDPNLKVDICRQRYYWSTHKESGDGIDWLVKRFSWPVPKVIMYLSNRPKISADLRTTSPAKEQIAELPKFVQAAYGVIDQGPVQGKRMKEILRLIFGYPEMDRVLSYDFLKVIKEQRWIPRLFIELGVLQIDDDEYCDLCDRNLANWKGDIFKAVIQNDEQSEGLYCRRCVAIFKRWTRAFDLLAEIKGEEWRRQVERKRVAGAGEDHTTLLLSSDP